MEEGLAYNITEGNDDDEITHHQAHLPFLKFKTRAHLIVPLWSTASVYGLIAAMLASIIASVGYECIHEYLRYLRHKALTKPSGPKCCDVQRVTCCEKLAQTLIQIIRMTIGYFMMLCVMTMNIWLLIAITVGAAVGYGVGKPLVANAITDSITSHGYKAAQASVYRRGSPIYQRSTSWRYQPIIVHQPVRVDEMALEESNKGSTKTKSRNKDDKASARVDASDIVWIRRSFIESENDSIDASLQENSVVVMPDNNKTDNPDNTDSIRTFESVSPRTASRFKSTSKVINQSFREERHNTMPRRSQSSNKASSSSTLDDTGSTDRRGRNDSGRSRSSKMSRSTSTTSSRYKPISKEIMRQHSFADDIR